MADPKTAHLIAVGQQYMADHNLDVATPEAIAAVIAACEGDTASAAAAIRELMGQ